MKKKIFSKIIVSVLSLTLAIGTFGSMSLQTRAQENEAVEEEQKESYEYDDVITFFGFSQDEIELNIGSVNALRGQYIQLNVRVGLDWNRDIVDTNPTWNMHSTFESEAINSFGTIMDNGYMFVKFDKNAEIKVGDSFEVKYILDEMTFDLPVNLPEEKPCATLKINIIGMNPSEPSLSGNDIPKEESKKEEPKYDKIPTEEEIAEQRAEAISKEVEEKIKAEEAIPVADFVSKEAVNAIPTEVKGSASTEAVFNVSKITTTRGFVAAVDKIVKENAKEKTVTLYSDKPFAFNAASLTAVAGTSKDFVYMFKHEGQLYKVTIPAGAKVDLEGQMFAGPLYIGAKLGTTVVVK